MCMNAFLGLLPLLLGAGPASKPDRCKAVYEIFVKALEMREMAAKDARLGPEFVSGTRGIFVEACSALSDADVDCVSSKKDILTSVSGRDAELALRPCSAAMDALKGAMRRYVQQQDPEAFARYQKAAMQTEARANLKALTVSLHALFEDDPAKVNAIAKLGPLPAGDCCKAPGKKCSVDAAAFSQPGWKDLGWMPEPSMRYHYSITRSEQRGRASFRIRAEGDPACEGKVDAWEVNAEIDASSFKNDEPHAVP